MPQKQQPQRPQRSMPPRNPQPTPPPAPDPVEEPTVTREQELHDAETDATQQTAVKRMLSDTNIEVTDFQNLPGAPPDGVILGPNQNMKVDGEMTKDGTTLILNKAVYRAFLPMGSQRWAFTLEHAKGAHIPASMVRPVAEQREVPLLTSVDVIAADLPPTSEEK